MAGFELISTVTTPASSYDLTTLPDVKAELEITDNSQDARLKNYISRSSLQAAQFCNRIFVQETVQDEFFPQRDPQPRIIRGGVDPLQLSRWPIVSVTSVTENGTTLVQDTDFRIDATKGHLIRLNEAGYPKMWPAWDIIVVYSAGYATIPVDIADAVIRMVKSRWFAKGRDPFTMQENIPGVRDVRYWVPSGTDAGNMPPDIVDILNNYRVPVTA